MSLPHWSWELFQKQGDPHASLAISYLPLSIYAWAEFGVSRQLRARRHVQRQRLQQQCVSMLVAKPLVFISSRMQHTRVLSWDIAKSDSSRGDSLFVDVIGAGAGGSDHLKFGHVIK